MLVYVGVYMCPPGWLSPSGWIRTVVRCPNICPVLASLWHLTDQRLAHSGHWLMCNGPISSIGCLASSAQWLFST